MTSTPSPAEHLEGVIAELQERWFFARAIDLTANPDAAPMVRDGDAMLTVLTSQAALISQRESEIERLTVLTSRVAPLEGLLRRVMRAVDGETAHRDKAGLDIRANPLFDDVRGYLVFLAAIQGDI
jgi:hypothetical protein